MYPDASNAVLPAARINLGINGDAMVITGGGAAPSPIVADGFLLQMTATGYLSAKSIYQYQTLIPINIYDTIRAVAIQPVGSTDATVNAFGGYLVNNNPATGGGQQQNQVLYYGVGIANVDNARIFGLNPVLQDSTVPSGVSAGTGRFLQNEFDFNVTSANTNVCGLCFSGASTAQPTVSFNAIKVNQLGVGIKWQSAFVSGNGAAQSAMLVGATAASGNNLASQPIFFSTTNAAGLFANLTLVAAGGDVPSLVSFANFGVGAASPYGPFRVHVATDQNFQVSGKLQLADGITFSSVNDANGGTKGFELNSSLVLFDGAVGIAKAGPPTYALDVAGDINTTTLFRAGATQGVTCASITAATVTTKGGIITHC
jgi:hypothetical protein